MIVLFPIRLHFGGTGSGQSHHPPERHSDLVAVIRHGREVNGGNPRAHPRPFHDHPAQKNDLRIAGSAALWVNSYLNTRCAKTHQFLATYQRFGRAATQSKITFESCVNHCFTVGPVRPVVEGIDDDGYGVAP
jgi:hypothetical protein